MNEDDEGREKKSGVEDLLLDTIRPTYLMVLI
jgi:hypothetical protein